ncbi:MAG TPA: indole-3-glycerol phosphate synthase TrpC [Solirubrobacteraceae bacterium]|nr:indole-3-glycerol phosphate synthase TrpC [Solirubrobacteraceae bacterium]
MTAPDASPAAPPTVLQRILDQTRETLRERKQAISEAELREHVSALADPSTGSAADRPDRALPTTAAWPFRAALARPGMSVIAEFKRRSPSAGELRPNADLAQIVTAYEHGGASALSILTEELNFEGSLDDLRAARAATSLPILRKDFVLDPYQLYEAKLAGADAILLIVAALPDDQLRALHALAGELGLDALVEVHDADELSCAAAAGATLIGVNNRDLRDFGVDVSRTAQLLARMPPGAVVVSESGISTPQQLSELQGLGVHAVLVGETLMRAPDPASALVRLRTGSPS